MDDRVMISLPEADVRDALEAALQTGGRFADLFAEYRRTKNVSFEGGKVTRIQNGREIGVGIRVVFGSTVSYAYTDELSRDALVNAARTAAALGREAGPGHTVSFPVRPILPSNVIVPPEDVKLDEKLALLVAADRGAREVSPAIRQVSVSYVETSQEVLVANSEGLLARDRRVRVRMMCQTVAEREGEIQTASESPGGTEGFEFFERNPAGDIGREAALRAVRMLEAVPAPSGPMPVVVGNHFGGVLIHEAAGHGLEGDAIAKQASAFAGRQGQQVASPLVTLIDDGTVPGLWGTVALDDEGTPARRNVLIENGVLKGYLYDRLRAEQANAEPTGSGRRQSYRFIPLPRMTNTYIAPGPHSFEEIIAATKYGLYAKKLGGGEVNITNGDFVFMVTEAYLIENGRITSPVRGAVVRGNGPECLPRIDMIANDLSFGPGNCGKEGQSVPVTVGQPHLRITELTVGGRRPRNTRSLE